MRRDTLVDFFDDLARRRGEFLVYDDGYRSRSYRYEDVGRAARGFAGRLSAEGLGKGDKVLFWAENRPEWLVAFWGCLLAGIVVVPIDYRSSIDFVRRVGRITQARAALVGEEVPAVESSEAASPGVLDEMAVWPMAAIDWHDTRQPPAPAIGRDHVAEIIFTSGATAEPKGVVITHRNILANLVPIEREVAKYRRYGRPFFPLRFLDLLPLSHMFGQAMATFIPPMLPGTTIFMRGYNPAEIVRQIRTRRVSVLVSVPKILDVLREHVVHLVPEAAEPPQPHRHVARRWWRYRRVHRLFGLKFWSFIVGAAPLEPALEEFWSRLGLLVIQGYGLTETAPIVSLNHPFAAQKGSVGKAIAGVEVRLAPDGEILVRGENVTSGYYNAPRETADAFEDGWLHTGDIGEMDANGRLFVRGRKKEMIVTPEGLNVFPEDVERVLNEMSGVRDSAVVGTRLGGEERVHAVLLLDEGVEPDQVVRAANARLADHQKIRSVSVWSAGELPRTEGTRKLKRREIREWVERGRPRDGRPAPRDTLEAVIAQFAGGQPLAPGTTIDGLGLSSLERVELMVALEERFETSLDEAAFARAKDIGELRALVDPGRQDHAPRAEPISFPSWNRRLGPRWLRRASLAAWLLPLTRLFAWVRVEGREHLQTLDGPVIFAANHQSHLDTPAVLAALPARWRHHVAPAMAKEFFKAHFYPEQHTWRQRFTNGLNYYLAALFFNAFPLPQREAGARQALRYIGELVSEGESILIFPEGGRTEAGEIGPFRPGVALVASRLGIPVVPVRIEGLDRVLHAGWHMARPGRVRIAFGAPLTLQGDDLALLARRVEEAVRTL